MGSASVPASVGDEPVQETATTSAPAKITGARPNANANERIFIECFLRTLGPRSPKVDCGAFHRFARAPHGIAHRALSRKRRTRTHVSRSATPTAPAAPRGLHV